MAVSTTTTWGCDRCGANQQRTDESNYQPDDWAKLIEVVPPRASYNDKAETIGIICFECRSELREWMAEGGPR